MSKATYEKAYYDLIEELHQRNVTFEMQDHHHGVRSAIGRFDDTLKRVYVYIEGLIQFLDARRVSREWVPSTVLFTLAHELGHVTLGHSTHAYNLGDIGFRRACEVAANRWAHEWMDARGLEVSPACHENTAEWQGALDTWNSMAPEEQLFETLFGRGI